MTWPSPSFGPELALLFLARCVDEDRLWSSGGLAIASGLASDALGGRSRDSQTDREK